ncbi:MAG: hypothetical protein ACRD3W_21235, partial [Terriglobales bacterium]
SHRGLEVHLHNWKQRAGNCLHLEHTSISTRDSSWHAEHKVCRVVGPAGSAESGSANRLIANPDYEVAAGNGDFRSILPGTSFQYEYLCPGMDDNRLRRPGLQSKLARVKEPEHADADILRADGLSREQ